MSNPCIKCGRERMDGKTWKYKVGSSLVVYTQTVCPNKECQKTVDKGIADRRAKTAALLKAKNEAKLAREKLVAVS